MQSRIEYTYDKVYSARFTRSKSIDPASFQLLEMRLIWRCVGWCRKALANEVSTPPAMIDSFFII